jgi:hypothetical protein
MMIKYYFMHVIGDCACLLPLSALLMQPDAEAAAFHLLCPSTAYKCTFVVLAGVTYKPDLAGAMEDG